MIQYAAFKNKLHVAKANGLFRFWEEVPDVEVRQTERLGFEWEGAKVPWDLWCQICSFMKWSQEQFKAEAHCTLFYNLETKEWRAHAFPQEPMGMTVNLLQNDPDYKEQRKLFGNGWVMAGSVHHHCTEKAFQSGTDSADEKDKEGVHVTIGDVLAKTVDLHVRKVWAGEMIETRMGEFFEPPPWLNAVPEDLRREIQPSKMFGTYCLTGFPEQWKANVKPLTFTQASYPGAGQTNLLQGGRTLVGGKESRYPSIEELMEQTKKKKKPKNNEIQRALDEYTTDVAAQIGCTVKDVGVEWMSLKPPADDDQLMMRRAIKEAYKDISIGDYTVTERDLFEYMYDLSK